MTMRSTLGKVIDDLHVAENTVCRQVRGVRTLMGSVEPHAARRCVGSTCCYPVICCKRVTARSRRGTPVQPDRVTPLHLAVAWAARLSEPRGKSSLATHLRRKLKLTPAAIGLIQEAALALDDPLTLMPMDELAIYINSIPVRLTGVAPIARAISTAGGISFDELDEHFMIRRLPGVFAAGEMLDWEAPTGGYLLQACFATAAAAADFIVRDRMSKP